MSDLNNNILIKIEPNKIIFPPTYISSIARITIKIVNESSKNAHFEWRKYATLEEEEEVIKLTDVESIDERNNFSNLLLYDSPTFAFEPVRGEIWARRQQDFLICFTPSIAELIADDAYLYVVETGQRIKLSLQGSGLPPDARFDIDAINIGHVALESIMEYRVCLSNVGKVAVDFTIEKKKESDLIFEFSPESGHIPIDHKLVIDVKFIANAVGPFNEVFTFLIKGATKFHPTLTLYGRVIGPTFSISRKSINFGTLSYGFLYPQEFEIENRSPIPFDFNLRLNQDGSFARREFIITPTNGTIGKYMKQVVRLEFIPISIKRYDLELHLDIAKFGPSLAVIPLSAVCICPVLKINTPEIDMGNLFIGHSYQGSISLTNLSDYPGKYEFVAGTDTSQLQARVNVPKPNGTIEANSNADFFFNITPVQLGPIMVTQFIKVYGSKDPPIPFAIKAICQGPCIVLPTKEINFNNVQLLNTARYSLQILNKSLINACFTANISGGDGGFSVSPESGWIEPDGTFDLSVEAYLDDNMEFSGKLNLLFENLNPITIDIKAVGIGSPIVTDVLMADINLGYIFSEEPYTKKVIFTNNGRKPQDIRWVQQKPKIDSPSNANFTFQVSPELAIIEAHAAQEFTFTFQCNKPSSFSIGLTCNTTEKRKRVDLYTPVFTGTFISPDIRFSKKELEFKHIHDSVSEEELSKGSLVPSSQLLTPLTETLQISNCSQLPLLIYVDCQSPFKCNMNQFNLGLDSTVDLEVTFDPSFKNDYISETVVRKLTFSFHGHPKIHTIPLKGIIIFSNLLFSPADALDFGILMTNTEQSKDIEITNVGELPVDFEWQLLPNTKVQEITKIFDINPIRSHLGPFEKTVTRFSFFSMSSDEGKSAKYKGTAICHVIGGPEYTIHLKGGSACIQYKLEPSHINLGARGFKEVNTQTLTLQNLSDAPINFSTKIPRSCSFQSMKIDPNEGSLAIGASVNMNVIIIGGLPKHYNELFTVQIGHFDEIRVDVEVNCYIPQAAVSLPRLDTDPVMIEYQERLKNGNLNNSNISNGDIKEPTIAQLSAIESSRFVQRMTEKVPMSQILLSKQSRRRKRERAEIVLEGPVSNRYLINMGNIVFGKIENHEFTIKNIVAGPISFEIYSEVLADTGFSITPTSFVGVPPNEEVTITVTFDNTRRSNDALGDVEYIVPLVFTEDIVSMIHIRANLAMPFLNFSTMCFNFGSVIVGQSKVMTLQLQNMNPVSCEFLFSEAQSTNVLQRSISQGNAPVFTANPSNCILPPASFQNVEITFTPRGDKNYSMHFPITIKHNTQQSFVTMKGTGVQLKVLFDPPELQLPAINPFSDPSSITVNLLNPTDYPIEVMAPQFDLQLLLEHLSRKAAADTATQSKKFNSKAKEKEFRQQLEELQKQNEPPPVEDITTNMTISKFSICVIISGPIISGKTTIAKLVSQYLNNVPIISLREVWKDLIGKEDSTPDDFIEALSNVINVGDCAEGFVIDGLDALPEPSETDQFISHSLKAKNMDIIKNPFLVVPHTNLTSNEAALNYILAALDGHYVFHIAIRAPEDLIVSREEKIKENKKKEQDEIEQKANEELFLMTEEHYLSLTEEEREKVDQKRHSVRNNILHKVIESIEAEENAKSRTKGHRSSRNADKRPRGGSKKSPRSPQKSAREDMGKEINRRRKAGPPTEPIPKSIMISRYTLGAITQKLQAQGANFQVIDPIELMHHDKKPKEPIESKEDNSEKIKNKSTSSRDDIKLSKLNKKENENRKSRIKDSKEEDEVLLTKLPHPHVLDEEETIEEEDIEIRPTLPPFAIQNVNTLLLSIDSSPTPDEINEAVTIFLPNIQQLEEKAFTRLIPPPRMIMPILSTNKRIAIPQMPQFFSIIGEECQEDLTSSSRINKQRPDSTKKNGRKSRTTKNPMDVTKILLEDVDTSKNTQRWMIDAKSQKTLNIQFNAILAGLYKDSITFALVNAKSDIFKLNVTGLCGYPDIDRNMKTIFPKRASKHDGKIEFSYVKELKEFHFGSLLIVKEKGKVAHYRQSLILHNISQFPVEFTAFLSDKQAPWYLETSSSVIDVDQTFQLFFGISPTTPGIYKNKLFMVIKDNPDPLSFSIVAEGCSPIIEASDDSLDFEKLLLHQSKKLTLEFRNTGKLPAFWRLKNTNALGDYFTFSDIEGAISPKTSISVDVTYSSSKAVSIKKQITLEVLDNDKVRTFITKPIQITAESFDVSFDFQFPKGTDHLQFGCIKVGQQKTINCNLVNKGKYPTNFKFTLATQKIQKMFTITPMEGSIHPGKPQQIVFAIKAASLTKCKNMKGINLLIIDSMTSTNTATLPIPFSVETFYSSFIINPEKEDNFGPIPINTAANKTLSITNNGSFPFEYEIVTNGESDQAIAITSKPSSAKRSQVPKTKGNTKKSDKIVQIGNFSFAPFTGIIQPNTTANIDIEFFCSVAGKSTSTALIKISDSHPKDQNGVVFKISAESFVPGINTTDYEHIFQGTQLCLRYDIQKYNQNVFLEDEIVLHFAPLILQQKSTIDVNIINPFPISCSVDINVSPKQKVTQKSSFPFDINLKTLDIPPNSSKSVELSFFPQTCEQFYAVFEAVVRGGSNPESKILKFMIEGTGTLPVLTVLSQLETKGKSGAYLVHLGRTLVGFTKEKTVAVKNDGVIPTRVQISAKASSDFRLIGFDSLQETTIDANHILNLPVVFAPQKAKKDQFDITLSVVDNPKANIQFSFVGEGFSENIVFQGLGEEENDIYFKNNIVGRHQTQIFKMKNVTNDDFRFSWMNNNEFTFVPKTGHLHHGQTKDISVTFLTEKPVKYNGLKLACQYSKIIFNEPDPEDWDDSMKVVKFVPKSTLYPEPTNTSPTIEESPPKPKRAQRNAKSRNSQRIKSPLSKSLTHSSPPQQTQQTNNQSSSNTDNTTGPISTQNSQRKKEEMIKVIQVKPEPPYQVQPTKNKDLILKATAVSDIIKYQIDTTQISFLPTMMYQIRAYEVKVTNSSAVRFDYSWILRNLQCLRTNYTQARKPPFSIMPTTGYIEAGQSVIFKVRFHPEEVDDFTCEYVMDIPFLLTDLPKISISAFSRRPLCHFNVEMSDYLTAGRRHPDYTDPLPTDIKVIEIFSPVVGAKRFKRFEIINPTSRPYEVKWVLKSDPQNCSIECDTPNAFISSGKRYNASFSYSPTSVKTVEVLWDFLIPEHGVCIPFLIVGRIMPTTKKQKKKKKNTQNNNFLMCVNT